MYRSQPRRGPQYCPRWAAGRSDARTTARLAAQCHDPGHRPGVRRSHRHVWVADGVGKHQPVTARRIALHPAISRSLITYIARSASSFLRDTYTAGNTAAKHLRNSTDPPPLRVETVRATNIRRVRFGDVSPATLQQAAETRRRRSSSSCAARPHRCAAARAARHAGGPIGIGRNRR